MRTSRKDFQRQPPRGSRHADVRIYLLMPACESSSLLHRVHKSDRLEIVRASHDVISDRTVAGRVRDRIRQITEEAAAFDSDR